MNLRRKHTRIYNFRRTQTHVCINIRDESSAWTPLCVCVQRCVACELCFFERRAILNWLKVLILKYTWLEFELIFYDVTVKHMTPLCLCNTLTNPLFPWKWSMVVGSIWWENMSYFYIIFFLPNIRKDLYVFIQAPHLVLDVKQGQFFRWFELRLKYIVCTIIYP